MPFKSDAQRKFMYSQHPEIAKEFQEKTPKHENLPERLHPKKKGKGKKYDTATQTYRSK